MNSPGTPTGANNLSSIHDRGTIPHDTRPPCLDHLSVQTNGNGSMPRPRLSSPSKRKHSELSNSRASQPLSKKQQPEPYVPVLPPSFWDRLGTIFLENGALRELDRRNALAATKKSRQTQTYHYTDDLLRSCGAKVLKDVEQFAKHGGPDLSGLRNYPKPSPPSKHTKISHKSSSQNRQQGSAAILGTMNAPDVPETKPKTTGPHNRAFLQFLVENKVFHEGYEYPNGSAPEEPNNWNEIHQRLLRPRKSLSPSRFSDAEFRELKRANAQARKEKQVSESVITAIEGDNKLNYRSGGIPFTNLVDLVNNKLKGGELTFGTPDIFYGARPEQLNRKVRDELSHQIIPSTQQDLPITPNFFLAAKGPDGSGAVVRRQACYDGALGARAMHALRAYGQEVPIYDGNAYTISSTYHLGHLAIFASHVGPPRTAGGRPEIYMTQLDSYSLIGNLNHCRDGLRAYRNARDWAKEQRDEAILLANERSNPAETKASAADADASSALNFTATVSDMDVYTVKKEPGTETQRPLTSVNQGSRLRRDLEKSHTSP